MPCLIPRALPALALAVGLLSGSVAHAAPPKPDKALEALAQKPPLTLSEEDLRQAGLADAPRELPIDFLLDRLEVRYDADGKARTTRHMVMRYRTREAVEALGTIDVPFSPWFEERPVVRGRVVPARGPGVALDPRTIAEAAAKNPELIVSDRKNLVVPLPYLAVGATVELVIDKVDHRSPYASPIRSGYHPRQPSARQTVVTVAAPLSLAPTLKVLGTDAELSEERRDGLLLRSARMRGLESLVAPRDGKAHGVMWSTGDPARAPWAELARRYHDTIAPVLAAPSGWPAETTGTRAQRIGNVMSRIARELRYTGLHLGDAAIVPASPAETVRRGYGDCKDLSTLVVRALSDAGVPAHVALLRAGDRLDVEAALPGLDLFDHAIVYVPAGADPAAEPALWLDPTAPEFGVGALPPGDLARLALVIADTTTALTPTPPRDAPDQADVFHLVTELRPEPIGPGTARLTYTFGGTERYQARRHYGGQDPEPLAQLERAMTRSFDGQIAARRIGGVDDALAPFTLDYDLTDVRRLDSDGRSLKLHLPMDSTLERLDDGLLAADRRLPYALPRAPDISIRYLVHPPAGYHAPKLPDAIDLALGPIRWRVTFTARPDGVIEAFGRYEVPKLDLSARELGELQEQAPKRAALPDIVVTLVPDQARLAPLERAAWFRAELARRPTDAVLRARWALELDAWGLLDEARREADRAAKDQPKSRFVLTVRARLFERDAFGRVYQEGWDRKRAIAAWRAVRAADPTSVWARLELADVLVRDGDGAFKPARDKEGDEGRALLAEIAAKGHEIGILRALEAWEEVGAWADIVRFAEAWRGHKIEALDARWAKAVALSEGPAAAVTLIESWREPPRVQAGLAAVTSAFLLARRFEDLQAALDRLSALMGGADNPLAEWSKKLSRLEPIDDWSTPERAFQSFYSLIARNPPDLAERLSSKLGFEVTAAEAEQLGRAFEPPWLGPLVGKGSQARLAVYDMVFGVAAFESDGEPTTGWKTTLRVPTMPGGELKDLGSAYFAPAEKGVRLVGFGGAGLAFEGLERLARGDVAGARRWLGWAWDGARMRPKSLSEPDDDTPVETLWRTGILLGVGSGRQHFARLFEAVRQGAEHLAGDERALALQVLAQWSQGQAERESLLGLIEQLFAARSASLNERAVQARVLAAAGHKDEALRIAAERLAGDPNNVSLIAELANIETMVGELERAHGRLAPLRDSGQLGEGGDNELAWLEVCLDRIDALTLEAARRGAAKDIAAAVHTRAVVEAARGLFDEAAASIRRFVGDDKTVDPSAWLVQGRVAELLGLREAALSYYRRVKGDEETGAASSTAVAKERIARLQR